MVFTQVSELNRTKVVRVGCSGWQYRHWRGDFYPAELPQSRWFAHYAGHVPAGTLPADWDVNTYANAVIAFVIGRWHQYAKSGFKRAPMDGWAQQWRVFSA